LAFAQALQRRDMRHQHHQKGALPRLPTEKDFDPYGGDLDAQSAWHSFGSLPLTEALAMFRENPIHYQEAFMFMGGQAFLFYFPVIDTYLRDFRSSDHEDDSHAAIIGSGVAAQLSWPTAPLISSLRPAIRSLADYVSSNSRLLAADPNEQRRIVREWQRVCTALDSFSI